MACACYRVEVCDSTRSTEAPLIPQAFRKPFVIPHAPAQFLSPVGMWTKVLDWSCMHPFPHHGVVSECAGPWREKDNHSKFGCHKAALPNVTPSDAKHSPLTKDLVSAAISQVMFWSMEERCSIYLAIDLAAVWFFVF